MNDNQIRHLVATLRQIDEALAEADQRLAPGAAERLFPPWLADAAPVQRQRNADFARRLRAALRSVLDRLGIAVPGATISGIWSARTQLMMAQVALAELEPKRLAGYGAVADEDAREMRAAVAELSDWLDRMESYLAQGPGQDLVARLARIGPGSPRAEALAELERIISTQGLVGFRPALAQLAERLAAPGLEVAVFGRVKAGKSSLLNRLLDAEVLPVGVMPVTEIPVRLVHGPAPIGQVEFTDAAAERFDLARLAEFVSAHQNPGNLRHVTRLVVELPAPLLADGIVFVDTPGVGLADDPAAAETLAYLPRCDLGLVLVDAAATLTDADVALVDLLRHAGAEAQVLLAKADLLAGQDLERSLDFIRRRLAERLGAAIPVHPVSARPEAAALTGRWLESTLRPWLADGLRHAGEIQARKFALLRDAVRAALVRRMAASEGHGTEADAARHRASGRALGEALARLDEARRAPPAEIDGLAGSAGAALDEAAHNAALIWNEERTPGFDATALVEASAQARAGVAASAAARQLIDLRAMARATLAEANGSLADDLPRPTGLPVLDAAGALPPFKAHRPLVLGLAGEAALRLALRHWMRETGLDRRLVEVFRAYGHRLDAWRLAALDELKTAFLAQREFAAGADEMPFDRLAPTTGIAADIRRLDEIGFDT
jgi:GTP-binding protein EngB required for normal cell division